MRDLFNTLDMDVSDLFVAISLAKEGRKYQQDKKVRPIFPYIVNNMRIVLDSTKKAISDLLIFVI